MSCGGRAFIRRFRSRLRTRRRGSRLMRRGLRRSQYDARRPGRPRWLWGRQALGRAWAWTPLTSLQRAAVSYAALGTAILIWDNVAGLGHEDASRGHGCSARCRFQSRWCIAAGLRVTWFEVRIPFVTRRDRGRFDIEHRGRKRLRCDFVGLDVVVLKETSVCVVDDAASVILEQKVAT